MGHYCVFTTRRMRDIFAARIKRCILFWAPLMQTNGDLFKTDNKKNAPSFKFNVLNYASTAFFFGFL